MATLQQNAESKIICLLCPHLCKLAKGKTGICGVRRNNGGKIELLTYGIISGISPDPIEKKPLYHFFPGSNILSVGSYGCNLRCDFCQNYHISQNIRYDSGTRLSPESLVMQALSLKNNIGIAYTYNEPVIWFEYVRDVALLIKQKGMKNVMVSNGYVTPEALGEFIEFTDAFNIDLKSFSDNTYRKLTGASLEPVKASLSKIAKSGKHLEVTTLIVTGQNDSEPEFEHQVKWMAEELGTSIPFHISRYFPMFRRTDPSTPEKTLLRLYEIASKHLKYVYIGNSGIDAGHDTFCPECKSLITGRAGYQVRNYNVNEGMCLKCGTEIYRNFTFSFSQK